MSPTTTTRRHSELLPTLGAAATASEALAYLEHVDRVVASLARDLETQGAARRDPARFGAWVAWRAKFLMWRSAMRRRLRAGVGAVVDDDASAEWDEIEAWHREAATWQRDWQRAGVRVESTRPTDAGDVAGRVLAAAPVLLVLGAVLWFTAPGLRRSLSRRL